MKGLLRKDLYMTWSYAKTLLAVSLLFVAMSLFADNGPVFLLYPMLLLASLPASLLGYDEKFKWDRTCCVLPLTRRQYVVEKYLYGLLCAAAALLILGGGSSLLLLLRGRGENLGKLLVLMLGVGLLGPAMLLPFLFRWGSEKGRLVYYFMVGLICALFVILMRADSPLDAFAIGPGALLLVLLVCAVCYGLSCLLSIRFYEKREL